MVLFLEGVVAQVVISDGKNGSYLSINIVTGVAVMLGMLVAGPVTGAHLNPAITVAFTIFQGFPLRKVPGYVISQVRFHVSAATRCWLLLFLSLPLSPPPEQILTSLATGWLYWCRPGLRKLQKRH
jgi:glycerol uptake facilitator-like aquaporin